MIDAALPLTEFDFVTEIAEQLPMRMLGRLLGTNDEDGRRLVRWGDALLGNTDPEFTDHPVDLTDTEEFRCVPFRSPAALEIFRYAQAQAADRKARPRDDIITQLLAPTLDGEPLTDLEFNNFFTLLVAAGNDTTRYTMAHGLWTMLNHPRLWRAWKSNPALTPTAVEEVRWVSAGVCQTADESDFLLFGELLAAAAAAAGRRVVVLASGGLSHRFWPLRQFRDHEAADPDLHIRTPEAAAADRRVIAWMKAGDHAAVLDFLPEFRRFAPEGFFGHYLTMLGAIGGRGCRARGVQFGQYESVAGTGQAHIWFDR